MRVLLLHNKYKEIGGEDAVLCAERALLLNYGHEVELLIFDNNEIKTVVDKLLAASGLIYNSSSARKLRKKIEEFSPDIIHVHNFVPLASPSVFFIASQFHIPVILTLHNYRLICPSFTLFHKNKIYEKSLHAFFPIDAILKGVYRGSISQTAAVAVMTAIHKILGTWKSKIDIYIALTHFARKKFETSSLSIPANRLVVKPNFVEDHGPGDRKRKDFFLFVGRLTEEKGISTLLEASSLATFKLVIVGDGPMRKQVEEFAKKNSNVRYVGFQDKPAVIDYMKTCRALVFPSIWYECFPITILEAFCAGTIVVASRLGGMAEIIEHKINGLHFEAGDARDLVARIAEISDSPAYLETMSANARLTYLSHYTPEKNYLRLMEIYDYAFAIKRQPRSNGLPYPVQQLTYMTTLGKDTSKAEIGTGKMKSV